MDDFLELLEELHRINERTSIMKIDVEVIVSPQNLQEKLPSGKVGDIYDDQTIEDWQNFLGNVEEIIEQENECEIVATAHSNKGNKMSTYYNFFTPSGKECLINLRVSDHPSTTAIRDNRRRHLKKDMKDIGVTKYKLYGIVVNNKMYPSYEEAEEAIKNLLNKIST